MLEAQNLEIFQDQITYEDREYPSYSVYLEPDSKEVKKELEDYMKDNYDIKLKGIGFLSNKDVLYADKVEIEAISSKKMDFFAKAVEEGERTKLSFFGAYGYSIPVGPQEDNLAYTKMRKVMVGFVNDYLPGYYTEQVEDVQDIVDDYRDDKEDLQDDISDNKKDIEKNLKEIEELRKENENLTKELSETSEKLTESEDKLKKVKRELDKVNTQLKGLTGN
jgi:regulator of replication initiation timing